MPSPFLEIVFPENVSYGAVGGCGWSTRVVVADSGREFRQSLWGRARGRWTVGHNLRSETEWDGLLTFHRLAQGKTFGFRFKDWTDHSDNGRGIVGSNSNGHPQLVKYYRSASIIDSTQINQERLISKPRPSTIAFFHNGIAAPSITVDYATGLVSGTTDLILSNYTWTGQFDVPARFDTDEPELSFDLPTAVGWRGVPIIEIRVDDP